MTSASTPTATNRPFTFRELHALFTQHGERPALTDASSGVTLSYHALHQRTHDFYSRLPTELAPQDRIILYDVPPLDWVPLFFAIILRGCIAVPLDTRVSADFFKSVEELTTPALVILGDATTQDTRARTLRMSDLMRTAPHAPTVTFPTPDPDAPAQILFTSGTWARPKGVVLSQRNILTNVQQVLSIYPHSRDDVSLAVLPLSHAYQQTIGLILPLLVGSHVVFLTSISSSALINALAKYRIQTMLVVPRVLSLIENSILRKFGSHAIRVRAARVIRSLRFLPRRFRRVILARVHRTIGRDLTTLIVGGAPLSPELDHFFQGLGYLVLVGYGASECAPAIAVSLEQNRYAGEVGTPLGGVHATLNERGEIVVSGDNLFLGYWPSLTRPSSFNTEDIAIRRPDGRLVLKGRTKNLIIYPSGDKIFCEDIEHIALQIPNVEDSCVVSVTTSSGFMLCCAIKSAVDLREKESHIRTRINAQLPFGVHVDHVAYLTAADFPYTHTLKANRQRIQQTLSATIAARQSQG